jgi:hypothetical protein
MCTRLYSVQRRAIIPWRGAWHLDTLGLSWVGGSVAESAGGTLCGSARLLERRLSSPVKNLLSRFASRRENFTMIKVHRMTIWSVAKRAISWSSMIGSDPFQRALRG